MLTEPQLLYFRGRIRHKNVEQTDCQILHSCLRVVFSIKKNVPGERDFLRQRILFELIKIDRMPNILG